MKIKRSHNQGMAIFAVILMFGAVFIIVGAVVYMLVKALRKLDRKINPPPSATNTVDTLTGTMVVYMPAFQFGAIPTPPNSTPAKPLGDCRLYIERTTNMIDWEQIADVTDWTNAFDFLQDDTNNCDRAFYRSRLAYP